MELTGSARYYLDPAGFNVAIGELHLELGRRRTVRRKFNLVLAQFNLQFLKVQIVALEYENETSSLPN